MKKVINHLVQLQELIEARAEQSATMPNSRLSQLDESIQNLTKELPPNVSHMFERLQKRNQIAIVPISAGICTGCGMALPISLVHTVHAAENLHCCPNCARILFYPSKTLPRRTEIRKSRFDPPKIGISRFSSAELMLPNIEAKERDDILKEICTKLETSGFINNGTVLLEEALRRESIMSTAVENGLAFPHVRGIEGGGLTLALATSKKGLHYDTNAKQLTKIIFFIVIPTAASAYYLKLLSGLSSVFSNKDSRQTLLNSESPEKLWKVLLSLTKTTIQ